MMRDFSAALFRASRTAPRAAVAAVLLAIACGLGGCASGGAGSGSFAMAGAGSTVAFESIDGPPPQVFDRMVSVLDSESKLRNLSIVSREGAATYRVRSYLSAQIARGRTIIAWVWDVYDRDQQRVLRLSGDEPASRAGCDPLDRGRRSGVTEDRTGRIERALWPGQRNGAGCAARPRAGRPRGGECGAAFTR